MTINRDIPFSSVEEFVGCFASLEELLLLFKTNPEVKRLMTAASADHMTKHQCLVALTQLERPSKNMN